MLCRRSHNRLESLFEDSASTGEAPQDELARLFVMDKLTGMGSKSNSASNLLGDRLGLGGKPKGKFDAQSGKWYRSATVAPQAVGAIGIQELLQALDAIKYDNQSQSGVVFNLVPCDSSMELSLMCIGDTHVDVDRQLQTALSTVAELLAAARSKTTFDSLAGFSLFKRRGTADSGPELGDVHTCAGMSLFSPADRPRLEDVAADSACGMSLFSYAPATKDSKTKSISIGKSKQGLVAQESLAGMTFFASTGSKSSPSTAELAAQDSCAGMTLFSGGEVKLPGDVTLDSACGMGLFSWNFDGMSEVEISKVLSEASTRGNNTPPAGTPVGSVTMPASSLTKVGSMSSVVSALNDDDVLELIEGFAGFTFFNRAPASLQNQEEEDELVAVQSAAGMTMFSRNGSSKNLHADVVAAASCAGISLFTTEDATQ